LGVRGWTWVGVDMGRGGPGVQVLTWFLSLGLAAPPTVRIVHSGLACNIEEERYSERVYTIREGETLELTCLVTGHPRPQIRWTKTAGSASDRFQDSSVFNETLRISNIQRHQGGRYYCKAENGLGSPAIKSIRVDVYYLDDPIVTVHQSIGEAKEQFYYERTVFLRCVANSNPPVRYSWRRGQEVLLQGSDKGVEIYEPFFTQVGMKRWRLAFHLHQVYCDLLGLWCGTHNNEHFPKFALPMLCEPIIQSICIPGLGFAITLSKHEAFLAYRYKRKRRLESKQLESLGEGETKILKLKNLRPQDYANYSCIASVRNVCSIPDKMVSFRLSNKTVALISYQKRREILSAMERWSRHSQASPIPSAAAIGDSGLSTDPCFTEGIAEPGALLVLFKPQGHPHVYSVHAPEPCYTFLFLLCFAASPSIKLLVDDPIVVNPGEAITLVCVTTGGEPVPSLTWVRSAGVLPEKTVLNGGTLTIPAITAEDAGTYSCIANNNVGNPAKKSTNIIVRALKKGRFWITPDPYHKDDNIQIGREVKISCQVEAIPSEELTFSWFKNGRPLRSSERMVITQTDPDVSPGTTNLDIIDLKFTDFGTYTCVASLKGGGISDISIDVNISSSTVPPNLTVPQEKSPLVTREGDTIELQCQVTGKPKPIILWSRADKEVAMPDGAMQTESYDGILRIVNVSREMTGTYRCQTSQYNGFNVKPREALVQLIVQCK
ncbi:hypothetical protein Q9233_001971, partial [Columba guinea]